MSRCNSRFQPTPSARRVTISLSLFCIRTYISTHPLRKEGDCSHSLTARAVIEISTHPLRKEGDRHIRVWSVICGLFQPTPSARRVTLNPRDHRTSNEQFQPTPSARRVTRRRHPTPTNSIFQPTPSARRVTLFYPSLLVAFSNFNPHPPQGG